MLARFIAVIILQCIQILKRVVHLKPVQYYMSINSQLKKKKGGIRTYTCLEGRLCEGKTVGGDGHLQARESSLRRNPYCRRLDLRLVSDRTVTKLMSFV